MLSLGARPRVYVCTSATDMRCSFNGLIVRTKSIIQEDPLSGHLFVFFNKRSNYVKILYWDEGGYCIWSKKLLKGSFEVSGLGGEIDVSNFMLILEGICLDGIKRRRRFVLKK